MSPPFWGKEGGPRRGSCSNVERNMAKIVQIKENEAGAHCMHTYVKSSENASLKGVRECVRSCVRVMFEQLILPFRLDSHTHISGSWVLFCRWKLLATECGQPSRAALPLKDAKQCQLVFMAFGQQSEHLIGHVPDDHRPGWPSRLWWWPFWLWGSIGKVDGLHAPAMRISMESQFDDANKMRSPAIDCCRHGHRHALLMAREPARIRIDGLEQSGAGQAGSGHLQETAAAFKATQRQCGNNSWQLQCHLSLQNLQLEVHFEKKTKKMSKGMLPGKKGVSNGRYPMFRLINYNGKVKSIK